MYYFFLQKFIILIETFAIVKIIKIEEKNLRVNRVKRLIKPAIFLYRIPRIAKITTQ